MEDIKLCANCNNRIENGSIKTSKCSKVGKIDLVVGLVPAFCSIARKSRESPSYTRMCGPKAIFFEGIDEEIGVPASFKANKVSVLEKCKSLLFK